MEMDVHEMLAMKAPITFEIACKAWGDDPNLCDDSTRKCFFAVWALLCFEWAEAMVEHARSRQDGLFVELHEAVSKTNKCIEAGCPQFGKPKANTCGCQVKQ